MIRFKNVSKVYRDKRAVSDVSLQIDQGETLVILGASGSGKTTLMKMVNRLIDPSTGTIEVDGVDVMKIDLVELRRQIGYAIQEIALFPHMNVEENIGLSLRLLKGDPKQIANKVDELLHLVGLDPSEFREKHIKELSGGQKQRVGVARALAQDPPIILLDEPFGALDPIIREQLQNEFLELESNIQKTIVFVTHDVSEAVKMADRIAIINEGKLLQVAKPEELLSDPNDPYIKEFFGKNFFQLKLMTKTLDQAPFCKGDPKPERLPIHSTFLDAFDIFSQSKASVLSVYDKSNFIGNIEKSSLYQKVMEEV